MYIYTDNNYVSRIDIGGYLWFQIASIIIGGGISVIVNGISNIQSGKGFLDGVFGCVLGFTFVNKLY